MEYEGPLTYAEHFGDNYSYYYDTNETSQNDEDIAMEFLKIFSTVSYSLIFTVSLVGNSFLLWALLRQEDLRRTSNILLLHLIVSDLMITIPLPIWLVNIMHGWMMGDGACRLLNAVFYLGTYSYLAFITVMTVHRYRAVVHSVVVSSRKLYDHLLCGALWVLCLICSIPPFMFSQTIKIEDNTEYCILDYGSNIGVKHGSYMEYVMYYVEIILFFLLPFVVILFCYSRMWSRIQQCRIARKKKTARLILLIVVGFFICWTPYNVVLFLNLLDLHGLLVFETVEHWDVLEVILIMSQILAYYHCCLSPIIHIFGAEKFRKRLQRSWGFRLQLPGQETRRTISNTEESAFSASDPV